MPVHLVCASLAVSVDFSLRIMLSEFTLADCGCHCDVCLKIDPLYLATSYYVAHRSDSFVLGGTARASFSFVVMLHSSSCCLALLPRYITLSISHAKPLVLSLHEATPA